ncbi:MAG TPA: Rid family detoxifying hydrolase [bacterium]|nr:Rid family detoxifying hydrolase [bacterium]
MHKRKIETPDAPKALGPYSQGIACRATTVVFVAGQIGIDAATGSLVGDTIAAQTEQAIANLLAIVKAAGGDQASIVKTTVYLQRFSDFAGMNEVYARLFQAPYPARACVEVAALPKNALVEIEAVAVLENRK